METQYKRNITEDSFYPLKKFRYILPFHWQTAKPEQLALSEQLSSQYHLPVGNILRLIMYVDRAWYVAQESEYQLYYSDRHSLIEYDKKNEPIEKITIHGKNGAAEITNPHLIDTVYYFMIDKLESSKKDQKKKRPSERIIKLIANEVYNEIIPWLKTDNGRTAVTPRWKALCITGYIFGLYNIGIKKDEYIMNQEQYKENRHKRKRKDGNLETYLQYLSGNMKSYT